MKIHYSKASSSDEAFLILKKTITPEYLDKFQMKVHLEFDENKKETMAKGSGFELKIKLHDEFAEINLELSLMYRAFKSTILDKIKAQIQKNL